MRRLRRKPAPDTPPNNPPKPTPEPAPGPNPPKPTPEPTPPTSPDAPIGNDLLNNNWWKYGLTGAGGFIAGRMTAPEQESTQPSTYSSYQY